MVQRIFCIADERVTATPPLGDSTSLPFGVGTPASDLEGEITNTQFGGGLYRHSC
jgi:hypothetical protein